MKILFSIIFIFSLFSFNKTYAQLSENHERKICINIINKEDFPDITFIAVKTDLTCSTNYEIISKKCISLTNNCKSIYLIAVPDWYFENKNIYNFNFLTDKYCLKAPINLFDSLLIKSCSNQISGFVYNINILALTSSEIIISYNQELIDSNNNTIKITDIIKPLKFSLQANSGSISNFEYVTNSDIRIYPNPVLSELNITILNDFIGDYTIHLSSLDGNQIFIKSLKKEEFTSNLKFEIGHLTPGLYILNFNFNNTIYTKRIVKRY